MGLAKVLAQQLAPVGEKTQPPPETKGTL